jgi:hypothetical protein
MLLGKARKNRSSGIQLFQIVQLNKRGYYENTSWENEQQNPTL